MAYAPLKIMRLTKARINKAIAHLNLEVHGNGDGYFYFVDTVSGYTRGVNVDVPRLNMMTLEQWIADAETARNSRITEGFEKPDYDALLERYGKNWILNEHP
jgi:hypothetical protein